jgi:hypothetical protein
MHARATRTHDPQRARNAHAAAHAHVHTHGPLGLSHSYALGALGRWCDGISDEGIEQLASLKQLRLIDVRNCSKLSANALESFERCRANAEPSRALTVLHSLHTPHAKPRRSSSSQRTRVAATPLPLPLPLHWIDPIASHDVDSMAA